MARQKDVWISADQNTVLFNSKIQVLTEEMMVSSETLVGQGREDQTARSSAQLFTSAFPDLEKTIRTSSGKFIFKELHSLVDMVTLCKILRRLSIQIDVLESFSQLPVRRLKGKGAIPPYYPGITRRVGNTTWFLAGGVDARPRFRKYAIKKFEDDHPLLASLKKNLQKIREKKNFSLSLKGLSFEFQKDERWRGLDEKLHRGQQFLSVGKYEKARECFLSLVKTDPSYKDGYAFLALAELALDSPERAQKSIDQALACDPEDPLFRQISFKIALVAKYQIDLDDPHWKGLSREALSDQYVKHGRALLHWGLYDAARKKGEEAKKLNPKNPEAPVVIARSYMARGDFQKAWKAYLQARRLYRNILKTGDSLHTRRSLALVLAESAYLHIQMIGITKSSYKMREIDHHLLLLDRALREAEESDKLAQDIPAGLMMSIAVRRMKAIFLKVKGVGGNLEGALEKADLLIKKFPLLSSGYANRGDIYMEKEEWKKAREDLSKALSLSPIKTSDLKDKIETCEKNLRR